MDSPPKLTGETLVVRHIPLVHCQVPDRPCCSSAKRTNNSFCQADLAVARTNSQLERDLLQVDSLVYSNCLQQLVPDAGLAPPAESPEEPEGRLPGDPALPVTHKRRQNPFLLHERKEAALELYQEDPLEEQAFHLHSHSTPAFRLHEMALPPFRLHDDGAHPVVVKPWSAASRLDVAEGQEDKRARDPLASESMELDEYSCPPGDPGTFSFEQEWADDADDDLMAHPEEASGSRTCSCSSSEFRRCRCSSLSSQSEPLDQPMGDASDDSSCNSSDGVLVNFSALYRKMNGHGHPNLNSGHLSCGSSSGSHSEEATTGAFYLDLHSSPSPGDPKTSGQSQDPEGSGKACRCRRRHPSSPVLDANCNSYPSLCDPCASEGSDLTACFQSQARLVVATQNYYKLVTCDLSSQSSPSPAGSSITSCSEEPPKGSPVQPTEYYLFHQPGPPPRRRRATTPAAAAPGRRSPRGRRRRRRPSRDRCTSTSPLPPPSLAGGSAPAATTATWTAAPPAAWAPWSACSVARSSWAIAPARRRGGGPQVSPPAAAASGGSPPSPSWPRAARGTAPPRRSGPAGAPRWSSRPAPRRARRRAATPPGMTGQQHDTAAASRPCPRPPGRTTRRPRRRCCPTGPGEPRAAAPLPRGPGAWGRRRQPPCAERRPGQSGRRRRGRQGGALHQGPAPHHAAHPALRLPAPLPQQGRQGAPPAGTLGRRPPPPPASRTSTAAPPPPPRPPPPPLPRPTSLRRPSRRAGWGKGGRARPTGRPPWATEGARPGPSRRPPAPPRWAATRRCAAATGPSSSARSLPPPPLLLLLLLLRLAGAREPPAPEQVVPRLGQPPPARHRDLSGGHGRRHRRRRRRRHAPGPPAGSPAGGAPAALGQARPSGAARAGGRAARLPVRPGSPRAAPVEGGPRRRSPQPHASPAPQRALDETTATQLL
ncbi:hypothetical protein JRQ81_013052 [Phrynocephalus forsythii]|uniref:Uncharacterized protein n=1 Tax=Phrynocephalus forsythii TaxID=171643 RepID=A0A9Q0Y0D4_9SAUR|nr:hypothetical protein JRQ81_013052 [Phrynocephalus forsythii]